MRRVIRVICGAGLAFALAAASPQAEPFGDELGHEAAYVEPQVVSRSDSQSDGQDLGCERGQDDRRSDLCAQWKAADAAHSSATAAWYLGIFGLLIGGLTLLAASRAAHWAKEAATYTRKTYRASLRVEDANLVFSFPSGSFAQQEGTDIFILNMKIANVGRSAAKLHLIEMAGRETLTELTIPSGGEETLRYFVQVPRTESDAQIFEGFVEYSTPFRVRSKWRISAVVLNTERQAISNLWAMVQKSFPEGELIEE